MADVQGKINDPFSLLDSQEYLRCQHRHWRSDLPYFQHDSLTPRTAEAQLVDIARREYL